MKKSALLFVLAFIYWLPQFAQPCNPQITLAQYPDGAFIPSQQDGLPCGILGQAYSAKIDLLIPPTTTAGGTTADLDSIKLNSATFGTFTSFSAACNLPICLWPSAVPGCISITSPNPQTIGTEQMVLHMTIYARLGPVVIPVDTVVIYNLQIFADSTALNAGCLYTLPPVANANWLLGDVFYDANLNTVFDAGDQPFTNGQIGVTGPTVYYRILASNGSYAARTNTGTYTVSFTPSNSYFTVVPASQNTSFASLGNSDTINFAVQPIPGHPDVAVTAYPISVARPGFNASYGIIVSNVGTETVSGSVAFFPDLRLTVSSSSPFYNLYQGDSVIWYFSNLSPATQNNYTVYCQVPVPPVVAIDTVLGFMARVSSSDGDENLANNIHGFEQIVVSSCDPNDIWVSRDGIYQDFIQAGEYLTYRIRFQNTGTASAVNISVHDTLDTELDWSTLQMIDASHSWQMLRHADDKIEWYFENIMLPDSNSNEPASHGYILYRIKPKSSFGPASQVDNRASIYFDFNPPVVTNTVSTTWQIPSGLISSYGLNNYLEVRPNPISGEAVISLNEGQIRTGLATIRLLDVSGKTIHEDSRPAQKQMAISAGHLEAGVYLLEVEMGKTVWREKVVKY